MTTRFTITPAGAFTEAARAVVARAETDPRILRFHAGQAEALLFCSSEGVAALQRERLAEGAGPSPSLGRMWIVPAAGLFRFDLQCSDASRGTAAETVRWILATFAPCVVFDEERSADVTREVLADPAWP